MPTRVLLTVDTELAYRHHEMGLSWQENFERSYEAAGVGVPYKLQQLAAHGLKACFFVDPMPALVFGIEPIRRMVAPIVEAGQEVQLHVHSFWRDLAAGRAKEDIRFELTDFERDGQDSLIATAQALLIEAGAPPPIAFRSGSYAVNCDTLKVLKRHGLAFDSSHNGSHHPWPSALPLATDLIDPVLHDGIVEVPVTQIYEQGGGLRHLQLCALSIRELEAALRHAARNRHTLVNLVSHSFELATRDGLRSNEVVRRRFDRLCAFLGSQRENMPTVAFADLSDLRLGAGASPLPARPLLSVERKAEQLWANARYERPATALTALSGSSASGFEVLVPLAGL